MRLGLLVPTLLIAAPAYAAGLMGSDTAWFSQFEQVCRKPAAANAQKCKEAVEQVMEAKCDMAAFWQARPVSSGTDALSVIPWPYGVAAVAKTKGVCITK